MMAEVDARFTLTDEQIAFMNSAEVARAQAVCDRHQNACGVGPIDFETGRRLPKHDLANIEAQQLAAAKKSEQPAAVSALMAPVPKACVGVHRPVLYRRAAA
jgi:hypothetical protein